MDPYCVYRVTKGTDLIKEGTVIHTDRAARLVYNNTKYNSIPDNVEIEKETGYVIYNNGVEERPIPISEYMQNLSIGRDQAIQKARETDSLYTTPKKVHYAF